MDKFEYGLYSYLTLIQHMSDKELRAAGLTRDYQKTVLTQAYPLSTNVDPLDDATYEFYLEYADGRFTIEEPRFLYDLSSTEKMSYAQNIGIAAHEIMHSVQYKKFYQSCRILPDKKTGYLAAGLTLGTGLVSSLISDKTGLVNMLFLGGAAFINGLSAKKIHHSMAFFRHEKQAMQHEGYVEHLFRRNTVSARLYQKTREKANHPLFLTERLAGQLVYGYPTDSQTDLYRIEGYKMAELGKNRYSKNQIDHIKKLTDHNIKYGRYDVYHID